MSSTIIFAKNWEPLDKASKSGETYNHPLKSFPVLLRKCHIFAGWHLRFYQGQPVFPVREKRGCFLSHKNRRFVAWHKNLSPDEGVQILRHCPPEGVNLRKTGMTFQGQIKKAGRVPTCPQALKSAHLKAGRESRSTAPETIGRKRRKSPARCSWDLSASSDGKRF